MKPEPLTPTCCDLRDFSWMPLEVVRLRDSDLAVLASGDAFRAAVLLWCAAWHQVPAASLPTDDRLLANLAGYGRDMKGWGEVRDDALRGFVECSDGRLYHPIVAEKALEAEGQRKAQKERTRKATDARRSGKRDEDRDDDRNKVSDDNRDDERSVVQQTRPDQTLPEQTKPVVVVVPGGEDRGVDRDVNRDKRVTTTTVSKIASQGSKAGLGSVIGRPLPAEWVPDDALCDRVFEQFGMSLLDVNAELPTFHALNLQNGTLSNNWGSTFYLFAKQWKVRQARAAPRLELSKGPTSEPISSALWKPAEKDWEGAAKLYASTGRWSAQFGPDPMSAACRCPPDILAKHLPNPEAIPVLAAAKAVAS